MKLHLGCGEKHLDGYINIDLRALPTVDRVMDVRKLDFADGVAELIYYCHGLEHLRYAEVQPALAEWRRVLRPGGVLRLAVPDYGTLAHLYEDGILPLRRFKAALSGGQEYEGNIHYSLWDYTELTQALEQAGYTQIVRWWPPSVLPEGFWDYSYFAFESVPCSLNIQAQKP